ncbi:hypothetical protein C8P68_102875 [Mucilaginibacter yixingensis]|uniref:Uncharacterized protein n=1 Tax=Mucilaginibacter yixingensis TaxID=1295612 RepID=A0A2T5JE58_9SPHI|nr:hypothetical protein [Mucilaginibacter yixingensis]PTR00044.1 hypothetical protein C8P68_102875 [Mucilaginibacter yixingensis]
MNIDLRINQDGNKYYNKWVKDTKVGLFIIAPALLIFYIGAGIVIYGLTLKYILISIYPVCLILLAFVRPYFSRKDLNKMVRELRLIDKDISIETYKWFSLAPIIETFPIDSITVNEAHNISFLKVRRCTRLAAP